MPTNWPIYGDISMLHELQRRVRQAVLCDDFAGLADAIFDDGLDPAARVRIYRHHALTTLGDALRGQFPVVCRLVDERFFAFATHEYVRARPPSSRCLAEYGADFPEFLADFAPCADLPYLADVARLEWALGIATTLPEDAPLEIEALAAIPPAEAARSAFRLQRSLCYIGSPWPIDAIWLANQLDEPPLIDAARGGRALLEIRRVDEAVVWRKLDAEIFAFRSALAEGRPLAAAIAAATLSSPVFEATAALREVLAEGLAVGFAVSTDGSPPGTSG